MLFRSAKNFGKETHAAHADRYIRAREFAQVVLGLWDTWEDDAMVYDKAAGVYMNPDKLHFLNHKGAHFSVRGPLMVQRSPQGRPVVVQAGGSDDGRQLAAETAEVIFAVSQELGPAREFYNDVKARGYILYPGKLTTLDTFRVGCMGQLGEQGMSGAIQAVGAVLATLG